MTTAKCLKIIKIKYLKITTVKYLKETTIKYLKSLKKCFNNDKVFKKGV